MTNTKIYDRIRSVLKLRAHAKINLWLEITGKLPNGYHSLNTKMTSVDIGDILYVGKHSGCEVVMDGAVQDEKNTAVKAVLLLIKHLKMPGMRVDITKHIPVGAGLGGSSADAAGVFFAAHKLYGIPLKDIMPLAPLVGDDVSFMIKGGGNTGQIQHNGSTGQIQHNGSTAKIQHNGTAQMRMQHSVFLIIKPESAVSTAAAYAKFDEIGHKPRGNTKLVNHLEAAAIALNPEVEECLNLMAGYTEYSLMCGSGSAVFGVFEDAALALAALRDMRWRGFAKVVKAVPHGVSIIA